LTIQQSKLFIFDYLAILMGGFGDVNDMWKWGPHVLFFSVLSLFFPPFLPLTLDAVITGFVWG